MAMIQTQTNTTHRAAPMKNGGLKKVSLIYRTPEGVPMVDLPLLGKLLAGKGYLSDEEILAHRSLTEAVISGNAQRIAAVAAKLRVRPKCIRVSFIPSFALQTAVVKAGGPVLIGPDQPVITSLVEVMRAQNAARKRR